MDAHTRNGLTSEGVSYIKGSKNDIKTVKYIDLLEAILRRRR
jgi:hypothetical protein